ncbi:hypothetical protein PQI23_09975 [Leucobacter sp. USCH14]|uniref:hypothetical protein n=1 Tax=Leucobacter sp. USCH14 TaxID=3024838 RepID=UPI0030ACEF28
MAPGTDDRRPLARAAGATATAALLLGTTALAPLSMTAAFAEAGSSGSASASGGAPHQTLAAAGGPSTALAAGVEVPIVESGLDQDRPKQSGKAPRTALYTLEQFLFSGVVHWGGYRFTYYSQKVLPGAGLAIPGRHVNEDGYVSDADGFIVLAGDAPKGAVFETPFGYRGKIYDRGTFGTHLDVYIE